jgi:hypothetical protein
LDHDYCTVSTKNKEVAPPPHSFYHSDASEYISNKSNKRHGNDEDKTIRIGKSQDEEKVYSRLPEYYMVLAPRRLDRNDIKGRKVAVRDDECWGESNSKKDSGLESGEVSDASEEVISSPSDTVEHSDTKSVPRDQTAKKLNTLHRVASKTSLLSSNGKNCSNILSVNGKDYHIASGSISSSKLSTEVVGMKPGKEMTMISVLKKCHTGNVPNVSGRSLLANSNSVSSESPSSKEKQQGPKKRKLNLEEYRSRIKELDLIRGSRESSCASSPVRSPSCSASISVGTCMLEDAKSDSKDNSGAASEVSSKPDMSSEECLSVAKDVESVVCESALQPTMLSVEVQTIPEDEVPMESGAGKHTQQEVEKERRDGCTRDRRKRQYRSRRASSSSSSDSSSSSGNSHTSRRHHASSRSRHRRRPR